MFNDQGARISALIREGHSDNTLLIEFLTLIAYCKNYEGRLVRGRINIDSYRFYDEREWRYVPPESELNGGFSWIPGERYIKEKHVFNDEIKDCYMKFKYSDISYIIVDTEDEIPEIFKTLNDVFENIITSRELKVLSTKIMTKNQIWNDF